MAALTKTKGNVMKKAVVILSAALFALGGCAETGGLLGGSAGGGSFGGNLIKAYVKNQCSAELNKRKEWRLITLAMSERQQQDWEDRICGCAAEEAPQQISAADLGQLVSEEGRTRVAAEVTAKTVTACFKRLYRDR